MASTIKPYEEVSPTRHLFRFDSWGQYLDWQKQIGQSVSIGRGFNTMYESKIHTLDDCIAEAREGKTLEGLEALRIADEKLERRESELTSQRFEPVHSVEGGMVDIGAYLDGSYENMVNFTVADTPQVENVVTLVIAVGVRGYIDTDAYRRRGEKIMALVEAIEGTGLTVEIWLDKTAENGDWTQRQAIRYKAAGELYDAGSLMWALTDVAMHRILGFNGMHAMPSPWPRRMGVGSSYSGSTMKRELPYAQDYPEGAIYFAGLSSNREADEMNPDDYLRQLGLLHESHTAV